ncbi:Fucose 4-O-acetylase [Lachnospiraceae bacterium]|nr:Fucose 4-O-acetylase [Lachnospiraceae bacterium]
MNTKIRINYLDLARGIGILLVVLGHISMISEDLRIYIVSFHIPLFFVASGLLTGISEHRSGEKDAKKVISGKFRSMMIPYFIFSVLDILIYIAYYLLTGRDGGWPTVLADVVQTVTFYGFSVLWFLPALFGAEVLFHMIRKFFARTASKRLFLTVIGVVMLFALALLLNVHLEASNALYGTETAFSVFHLFAVAMLRIPVCCFFFTAGYLMDYFWERARGLSPTKFSGLTAPADIFIGADLMVFVFFAARLNGVTDLHFLVLGNAVLYVITALAGSLGIILFCKGLEQVSSFPPLKLLTYYGRNSLIVMVTHLNFYVLLAGEIGGQHFTKHIAEGDTKNIIFVILSFIFTMIGEIFLIEVINRFFPFLIGKKR